jgi:hypothetical protein
MTLPPMARYKELPKLEKQYKDLEKQVAVSSGVKVTDTVGPEEVAARAWPHRRVARPLIHFIPDPRRYSLSPPCMKR